MCQLIRNDLFNDFMCHRWRSYVKLAILVNIAADNFTYPNLGKKNCCENDKFNSIDLILASPI